MLHVLLALNCIVGGRKHLEIDKLMDVKTLRVAFNKAVAMLVQTDE